MANLDVALTLRLINGLSGPARQAVNDLRSVKAAAQALDGSVGGRLADRLRASGTATGGLVRGLEAAASAGGRTSSAVGNIANAAARLSSSGTATGAFARGLEAAAVAGGRTSAVVREVASAASRLSTSGSATASLARGLDQVAASGERASAALARAAASGERLKRPAAIAGATAAAVTPERPTSEGSSGPSVMALGRGPLAAVSGAYAVRQAARMTIGEAISFEKAWAEVLKKVNDAPSPAAMDALQQSVRRTAMELGLPREKVAAITAEAAAAGTAFSELDRMTRLAVKASVAWNVTPEDAGQKLAYIRAAMGATIGEAETIANKINAFSDNSPAKESDLLEMVLRAGPAAKAAGVDLDTSMAFLTAIRSTGMQEEVAARFWSAFTGKLATAGAGGKGAKSLGEGLKMLGLTTKEVADGMRKDAGGTILDMFDRLNKAAEPAKAALNIAGGEWWDEMVRAAQANAEIRKQREFGSNPANFRGSIDANLAVHLATTASHLAKLKELSKEVGDRLGAWALPPINKSIDGLLAKFDELDRRFKTRDAGSEPESGDAMGRLATQLGAPKAGELAKSALDKVLDATIGRPATADPEGARAASLLAHAVDQDKLIDNKMKEAAALDARAKNAEGAVRADHEAKAATARGEIAAARESARLARIAAGPALGRDTDDAEVGEAFAGRVLRARRELREREALLAKPGGSIVFDEERGRHLRRDAVGDEVTELRKKLDAMTKGASVYPAQPAAGRAEFGPGGAPVKDVGFGLPRQGAASFPLAAEMAAGFKAAAGAVETTAGEIKAKMAIDLSGAGAQSIGGFTSAFKAGGGDAVAYATELAGQLRAALNVTITPTIAPRINMPALPSGGGGTGGGPTPAGPTRTAGGVSIGTVHLSGVNDFDGFQREVTRLADARTRDAQGDALHDLGSFV